MCSSRAAIQRDLILTSPTLWIPQYWANATYSLPSTKGEMGIAHHYPPMGREGHCPSPTARKFGESSAIQGLQQPSTVSSVHISTLPKFPLWQWFPNHTPCRVHRGATDVPIIPFFLTPSCIYRSCICIHKLFLFIQILYLKSPQTSCIYRSSFRVPEICMMILKGSAWENWKVMKEEYHDHGKFGNCFSL